jgi:hypothetical protein
MSDPIACHAVVDALLDHELGELGPDRNEAVRAHLTGCQNCARTASGLRLVPGMIRAAFDREPMAEGLAKNVEAVLISAVDDKVRQALQRSLSVAEESDLSREDDEVPDKKEA